MDLIYDKVKNTEHIHIFNHVRVALKVLTAADIVSAGSGHHILEYIKQGQMGRTNTLVCPESEKLPKRWIDAWNTILSTAVDGELLL